MLDSFKSWLTQRNFTLELLKKPWVLALAGAAVTLLIVTMLWRGQVDYVPLYGLHQHVSTEAVTSALANEKIAFRINPDNGQVLVADTELPRARMVLAAKNIQPIVAPGFEIMDKDEVLGASQYIQNIRYQRGLEGELARSIMSLQGVEDARVHLGIQAESGFVLSNQPASTASVLVTLNAGMQLTPQQVRAITQLVAGSVPGLSADNVHIVDQTGALLDANSNDAPLQNADLLRNLSQPIRQNLIQLLDSTVGPKNYRVTVMPDIDFRHTEETQETYQGEPKVLEEQVNSDTSGQAQATGVPGTLSNRPPAATASTADAQPKVDRNVSQTQRKFAYDHKIQRTSYPSQQLARLQIAVALNSGSDSVAKMTTDQLTQLKSLLENAAGIDNKRGDTLTVDKLAFIAAPQVSLPVLSWWQQPDIQFWAIWGGVGVLLVLFILVILRPAIKAMIAGRTTAAESQSLADSGRDEPTKEKHQFETESDLPPRASGIEDKVSYLQQLAANETDRVAEVIKQWINSNDRPRDNV